MLILLGLGVLWAAVLGPPFIRHRHRLRRPVLALVAAGRDLADYPDLGVDDLADSPIGGYLDQSYDAGYDTGYDDGEASVDVTSDNQSVCEPADVTWDNFT